METESNENKISLKEAEIRLSHYKEMYEKERQEKESIVLAFQ